MLSSLRNIPRNSRLGVVLIREYGAPTSFVASEQCVDPEAGAFIICRKVLRSFEPDSQLVSSS